MVSPMTPRELLDHHFLVAAYSVTWLLQGGYLLHLGLSWLRQSRILAEVKEK